MFKVLGVLLLCYVAQALLAGAVFAKSGPWGRTFRRDVDGWSYWSAVSAYALLSIALLVYF
jgi:hypothetical protein